MPSSSHGLQGFTTLPSHFSCNIEKITSTAFPFQQLLVFLFPCGLACASSRAALELDDLHHQPLHDFYQARSYISDVQFHVVPNQYLAMASTSSNLQVKVVMAQLIESGDV
ncbi:hypothetical protein NL676_008418 [Syzygium grande]|nr:hypothetical protein NL676_008418 [Syzygium grande]